MINRMPTLSNLTLLYTSKDYFKRFLNNQVFLDMNYSVG